MTATIIDNGDDPQLGWRCSHFVLCGWRISRIDYPTGRDYIEYINRHAQKHYEVIVYMRKDNLWYCIPFPDANAYKIWRET